MCGRYHITPETIRIIQKFFSQQNEDLTLSQARDVHPSEAAVVLMYRSGRMISRFMNWGFPQQQGKSLLINARAETVTEKKLFRDSVTARRCIIPAANYYEWDPDKNKTTISQKESGVLYMAGFYNMFQNQDHFVIITTQANDSVKKVHDRMPLILREEDVDVWLAEGTAWQELLKRVPPELKRFQAYEQQKLFLTETE